MLHVAILIKQQNDSNYQFKHLSYKKDDHILTVLYKAL